MTNAHRPLTDETRGYRKDMQPGYVPVAHRKMTKRAAKAAQRRARIIEYFRDYCAESGGIPPKTAEVMAAIGLCSVVATQAMHRLAKDGLLIDRGEFKHPRYILPEVAAAVRAALGGDK